MLDINGCIITIDAIGTQKDIAEDIIEGGGDYVLSLKENQKILYDDVELFFKEEILTQDKEELEKESKYYKTLDNSHGRFEKREYYICNDIDWLSPKDDWKGLSGIGLCISHRTEGEKTSISYNYAIYSIKDCTAEQFATYKRGHWGIENSLHWVLDIAFREDESRARKDNSAENFNIIRHMALNLLKQEKTKKIGIESKRMLCGWDEKYLLKVLNVHQSTI
jgi:Transposase DDE domain.